MKKFLVSMIMLLMLAAMLPLSAEACPRHHRHRAAAARRYRTTTYATRSYVARRPSFYRRHRNMVNIGVATGAGALMGGLIGGRRGVGLGMLTGLGAGALYTYKLNPKKRRY